VLDLADQAHDSADNAELKALIEQARPLIENHLKQAETIEKELGATA
jgi:predicted outer membrane protein